MSDAIRVVTAGDSAVVVEFEDRIDPAVNARAIALADSIAAAGIAGVRDVVPTYRSVAVYFDPLRVDYDGLIARIERDAVADTTTRATAVETVRIPVCYGEELGPDLAEVAAFARLSPDEVARVHAAGSYRVFMLGFVAGFAYLGTVDERIAMPRQSTPRLRVPTGSVGIAGVQTGIYPADTPGGWRLIGRTPVKPFDAQRDPPFLMKAGDTVTFYAITRAEYERVAIAVIKAGMLTTVQDRGRWGYQSRGVPVAGPMDPVSHRMANALVGNDADAALLEITLLGPELEFGEERVAAVAGADFDVSIDGRAVAANGAFLVPAGARLRFGQRRRGARAYLAVAGGIAVAPTLGSRATHVISGMGGLDGRPLRHGDTLPMGTPLTTQRVGEPFGEPIVPLPEKQARLRVLPGPQRDRFADDALDALVSAPYAIAQNSDRMGFRLTGPKLTHAGSADVISDATPLGVLQVPASGQPILLMADRQTTGGYPKIATVISADLAIAGQLAPGDEITFAVCSAREAIAALIAQEQALMRVESR